MTGEVEPGKALLRIRVIRLDGGPLRLWDCFSRAGGYGASAATLMLGFLVLYPLMGHASWHAYRDLVDVSELPPRSFSK